MVFLQAARITRLHGGSGNPPSLLPGSRLSRTNHAFQTGIQERGHVRPAVLFGEDQQVALPVAENLASVDLGGSVLDPTLARDRAGAGLATEAVAASSARLGQVAVEAVRTPSGPWTCR